MTKTAVYPTIHMNGTSQNSLTDGYMNALNAVQTAMDTLARVVPHGRDYYPQGPEAILLAQTQHREHMGRLNSVVEDLSQIVMHIIRQ